MTTNAKTTAKEASHYYDTNGTPRYSVIAKGTGLPRPTTLADARKLGLVPSSTTILKCLHKQALVDWLIEQACLAVLTTPRNEGEELDAFVHRVLHVERVQEEEGKAARDRGTEIHEGLEALFRGEIVEPDLLPWVKPAFDEVKRICPRVVAVEKVLVGFGYAGRTDFIGDSGPEEVIIDFKTTKKLPERGSWTEHRWQLASYAAARQRETPRVIKTGNLYISTVEPGKFIYHENPPWQADYANGFAPLLKVWCHMNNYHPPQ